MINKKDSSLIKNVQFIKSSSKIQEIPEGDSPEFAFIGRSNVGKSSLINYITDNKKLAKISSTPGKTQLINHFSVDKDWFIVDLPGYGYAKVSKSQKKGFSKIIYDYILYSKNLICLFVLLDIRREPQDVDMEFLQLLGENQIPFAIVFTKIDKLSQKQILKNYNTYKKELLKSWEEMPDYFLTSSVKKKGKFELIDFISSTLENFRRNNGLKV